MTTEITIYDQWYDTLISDLNEIVDEVVEVRYNYAWELINCHHRIGTRILQDNDNFERSNIYGEKIVQRVATSLGRSERDIRYCIKFANLYPDLNMLPEGKNAHWKYIVNKYLTTGEKKPTYPLIKKVDLLRMIKEIKELLNIEYLKAHQEEVTLTKASYNYDSNKAIINFIRYLQDQVNKITKELEV